MSIKRRIDNLYKKLTWRDYVCARGIDPDQMLQAGAQLYLDYREKYLSFFPDTQRDEIEAAFKVALKNTFIETSED